MTYFVFQLLATNLGGSYTQTRILSLDLYPMGIAHAMGKVKSRVVVLP